jgi:methyl-accepting chemotaxis protein
MSKRPQGDALQTITDEVTQCARSIRSLTGEASSENHTALNNLGRHLEAITVAARRNISGLRSELEQTAGPDDQSDITRAFNDQQKTAASYVLSVERLCEQQQTLAGAAVEAVKQCSAIVEAGQTITTVSRASRLLSLNAATSAARIGVRGAAVGIIANQMQTLSDEIQEVNSDLQELVTNLMQLLPRVVQQADAIRTASHNFAQSLEDANQALAGETEGLDKILSDSLVNADARLRTILSASGEALRQIRFRGEFEDRLFQLQIDSSSMARRVMGQTGCIPGRPREVEAARPMSTNPHNIESGELMLF